MLGTKSERLSAQIKTQEGRDAIGRLRRGAQQSDIGREHVDHSLSDVELGDRTGACDVVGHALGVGEQDLILADMEHDRRQAGKIAI